MNKKNHNALCIALFVCLCLKMSNTIMQEVKFSDNKKTLISTITRFLREDGNKGFLIFFGKRSFTLSFL